MLPGDDTLLQLSLTGGAAFRDVTDLLRGLTLAEAQATVAAAPHTIAELLAHLQVTMRASLDLASGKAATWPADLDVWPAGATSQAALDRVLSDLTLLLAETRMLAADPSSAGRDLLTDLAVHNAYHWGQVALLRRQLGHDFAAGP